MEESAGNFDPKFPLLGIAERLCGILNLLFPVELAVLRALGDAHAYV
jgi:hypothetical protein